ncbi:histone-lysine N-methyltransferase SETMAR [Ditylenchus destructor]|uniref:Histone-lysine N-methyltransferase SETMAR n=1 Tax=Ditylenchus destructor TaxID=166010 RepID=A0AAD4QWF3_9BILA|nr:histone-lysine N-methyltransferase SETMAR [Ditylenchus destructor]
MLHDQQQAISYLLEECDAKGKKLDHTKKEQWVQKVIQSAKQMRQSENIAKAKEKNGNCENKIQTLEQKLQELQKENHNLKKELEAYKTANKFEIAGYEVNDRQLFLDMGAALIGMNHYYYSIKHPEKPLVQIISVLKSREWAVPLKDFRAHNFDVGGPIMGVIRELLKYEYELGHSVKEAIENINRAKGAGTVAQRTAYEWYSKFRSGNLTIEDNPRSGRPREVDRAAVVNAVNDAFTIVIS